MRHTLESVKADGELQIVELLESSPAELWDLEDFQFVFVFEIPRVCPQMD